MAKKDEVKAGLESIFKSTEKRSKRKQKPKGVYLRPEEQDRLEEIAFDLGADWNVHKLIKTAISRFISDYDEGKIKIKKVETTELE